MKTRIFFLPVLSVCLWASVVSSSPAADSPIARPPCGPLRGAFNPFAPAVREFKGISFAQPPVGDLRWKPPQPIARWTDVRDATKFGKPCPQPADGRKLTDTSEDCLYLNVSTTADPAAGEKRPVMVWIHGGGFVNGAGSEGGYSGMFLAPKGVVLVTINYRLGALGFLAHPALTAESPHKASGNYGLLDQIAALQWVRDNIAAFGGDPGNVTLFGESAGAFSIARLMVSPLAQGLYHKAIIQSGTAHLFNGNLAGMEKYGEKFAAQLGCDPSGDVLAQMRSKSAAQILAAQKIVSQEGNLFDMTARFMPCVDGYVLPDQAPRLFERGEAHRVPLLIGTNADEGLAFMLPFNPPDEASYNGLMRLFHKSKADVVLGLYPFPKDSPGDARKQLGDMATVGLFAAATRWLAEQHSGQSNPVYLYQFTRIPNTPQAKLLGAHHALEILYLFGFVRIAPSMDDADRSLSVAMAAYWTSFARTGDPNTPGLAPWPRYERKTDEHLELGTSIRASSHLLKKPIDAFLEHKVIETE